MFQVCDMTSMQSNKREYCFFRLRIVWYLVQILLQYSGGFRCPFLSWLSGTDYGNLPSSTGVNTFWLQCIKQQSALNKIQ